MNSRSYYVYILASRQRSTLYIGITNNICARLEQHRGGESRNSLRNTACSASYM